MNLYNVENGEEELTPITTHPIRGDLSMDKMALSMDERAHSLTHPIRLVERICIKFHEKKFIPWNQRRIPWMEY